MNAFSIRPTQLWTELFILTMPDSCWRSFSVIRTLKKPISMV